VDGVAVPVDMLAHWQSNETLGILREALLQMLELDDGSSRSIAALLRMQYSDLTQPEVPANAITGHPRRRGQGQGFQTSKEIRAAVERQAMTMAIEALEDEGWEIRDVSAWESFDLLCIREQAHAYAEVKGTIGAGERIILTRAEVEFARAHRSAMMLVVVSDIELRRDDTGQVIACKGVPEIYRSWAPEPSQLEPIAYFCQLNSGSQDDIG
jgi:hypothetical protein